MTHPPSCAFRKVLVPVSLVEIPADAKGTLPSVHVGDVDLGFNAPTQRALELAGRLATGGTVVLFHAIRDLTDTASFLRARDAAALEDAAREKAAQALDVLATRLLPGVDHEIVVTLSDDPVEAILAAARDDGIEAVVLATSGRTRVQRAFLGSTADKVIRRAPCPVVVIPANPH